MRGKPDPTSLYLFNTGENERAYEALGAHIMDGGCRFAVWAPNARSVHIAGSFNGFDPHAFSMQPIEDTGVFQAFIPGVKRGDLYKYVITDAQGETYWRSDPYAFRCEKRPGTASMVWGIPEHDWKDGEFLHNRGKKDFTKQPINIYELHAGSFKRGLCYRDMAIEIVDYVADMGYTHIELMPLSEYPLDMSWGYQVIGYYAVTNRYGTPEELMYLIDYAHQKGLGVILDWVPAHFPRDEHGLRLYDGTALYEHFDPRRGEQKQWGTMLFDFGRPQVQSFLMSNAYYWLKEFHFDGLRVDAVSCILYLDYGKQLGEWLPNIHGGRENLDGVAFFKKLSTHMADTWKNNEKLLIAEESTAFPYITKPVSQGGLGFHLKWNMGFMNDTLKYMGEEPIYRKWHHGAMTFSLVYAFSENYLLPYSHDEVVHGKRSMLDKMPGDYWEKFAQLRLLLAYQFAHPGKKLNFMGTEFGQFIEWRFDESLDWLLLDYPAHRDMQTYMRALNKFYINTPQLYERDSDWGGFTWAIVDDTSNSVFAFIRWDDAGEGLLCVFNFKPNGFLEYSVPLPFYGACKEVFSSDSEAFGGAGEWRNDQETSASQAADICLPPFGAVFFSLKQESMPIQTGANSREFARKGDRGKQQDMHSKIKGGAAIKEEMTDSERVKAAAKEKSAQSFDMQYLNRSGT